MKILYNYPSRSRPALFRRGVESIIENSDSANFEILAIVDDNDLSLKDYNFDGCTVLIGSSKSKVDAINRGHEYILNSNADIIVNMSDDMMFTKKGFDSDIMDAIGNNWDQCIHFPDGTTGDKLIYEWNITQDLITFTIPTIIPYIATMKQWMLQRF